MATDPLLVLQDLRESDRGELASDDDLVDYVEKLAEAFTPLPRYFRRNREPDADVLEAIEAVLQDLYDTVEEAESLEQGRREVGRALSLFAYSGEELRGGLETLIPSVHSYLQFLSAVSDHDLARIPLFIFANLSRRRAPSMTSFGAD